jgi:hypothetical protein
MMTFTITNPRHMASRSTYAASTARVLGQANADADVTLARRYVR